MLPKESFTKPQKRIQVQLRFTPVLQLLTTVLDFLLKPFHSPSNFQLALDCCRAPYVRVRWTLDLIPESHSLHEVGRVDVVTLDLVIWNSLGRLKGLMGITRALNDGASTPNQTFGFQILCCSVGGGGCQVTPRKLVMPRGKEPTARWILSV